MNTSAPVPPIQRFNSMFIIFILLFRLIQRVYFLLRGHRHSKFDPRKDIEELLKTHNVHLTVHTVISSVDGTKLSYRKIGSGKKIVYLANGVGTGFFMWLSCFREMLSVNPRIFEETTIIIPTYRGLLVEDGNDGDGNYQYSFVKVDMERCVSDAYDIIVRYEKLESVSAMVGWSMGAQMILTLCSRHPKITERLFLLNPSTGKTLHTALQPIVPLFGDGGSVGKLISYSVTALRDLLQPVCDSSVWPILKSIVYSPFFYYIFVVTSFLGGFPPEQASYFTCYCEDIFSSRSHTKHLLDLIVSLDAPLPDEALSLKVDRSTIVSGLTDVMTGVYHSTALAKGIEGSRHVMFTMGSHFVLIEWPREVAAEIIELILGEEKKRK